MPKLVKNWDFVLDQWLNVNSTNLENVRREIGLGRKYMNSPLDILSLRSLPTGYSVDYGFQA